MKGDRWNRSRRRNARLTGLLPRAEPNTDQYEIKRARGAKKRNRYQGFIMIGPHRLRIFEQKLKQKKEP